MCWRKSQMPETVLHARTRTATAAAVFRDTPWSAYMRVREATEFVQPALPCTCARIREELE
jgi:hypothetical protein